MLRYANNIGGDVHIKMTWWFAGKLFLALALAGALGAIWGGAAGACGMGIVLAVAYAENEKQKRTK